MIAKDKSGLASVMTLIVRFIGFRPRVPGWTGMIAMSAFFAYVAVSSLRKPGVSMTFTASSSSSRFFSWFAPP